MDEELNKRVQAIRTRLEKAALERWGRAPEIIAVSKTVAARRSIMQKMPESRI